MAEARNYIAENRATGCRSVTRRSSHLVFEHSNGRNWPVVTVGLFETKLPLAFRAETRMAGYWRERELTLPAMTRRSDFFSIAALHFHAHPEAVVAPKVLRFRLAGRCSTVGAIRDTV